MSSQPSRSVDLPYLLYSQLWTNSILSTAAKAVTALFSDFPDAEGLEAGWSWPLAPTLLENFISDPFLFTYELSKSGVPFSRACLSPVSSLSGSLLWLLIRYTVTLAGESSPANGINPRLPPSF